MKNCAIVFEHETAAVEIVFAAVSDYITPVCMNEAEANAHSEYFRIYVGKNPYAAPPAGGYCIKTVQTENGPCIVLDGDGEVNLLYAAVDFKNKYLAKAQYVDQHSPTYFLSNPFRDPLPACDLNEVPYIQNRALWTWGYVIYDYKRYLDHMLELKLNMLVIWNDYPPVNAKEIVSYAHKLGIKIIWGFAWGWDTSWEHVDLTNLDAITKRVTETYKKDYAHLEGDGIYFQTFTETSDETIGGIVIAEAAVQLVNQTSAALLEEFPGLKIQFGLHATSVKNRLEVIRKVDKRVTVIWEDCGAFPYHYIPKNIENFSETEAFTDKIKNLNGGGFGAVLKGLTCLDWSTFVHQPGKYVMGCRSEEFIRKRTQEKQKIWKYVQAYWIRNAAYAYKLIQSFDRDTVVMALVEDGMFEENIWYPVALYAEMLWHKDADIKDILCDTVLMPNVTFA